MNVEEIFKELKHKYPGKAIIKNENKQGEVTEILCEIEPASKHPHYSNAIAIIDKSEKHLHNKTTETYTVLKGCLKLYIDEKEISLNEGESYEIDPGHVHYAVGDATWVECRSQPGWVFEDHVLVSDLLNIVQKIVDKGIRAINNYLEESELPIDYVAVFAQSKEEYKTFSDSIEKLGQIVEETSTGFTYKLNYPLKTAGGQLLLVKIRKYDKSKPQLGAPDFRVEKYSAFKKKYKGLKNMNLIERPDYEMLELIAEDVLIYFPDKPLSVELGIN